MYYNCAKKVKTCLNGDCIHMMQLVPTKNYVQLHIGL